jgi:GNAT superfamily N-acetyltransferase
MVAGRKTNLLMEARVISHKATQVLRHVVLWPHKSSPAFCTIPGDEDAIHLGAFADDGEHVGVCSLFLGMRSERFPKALPGEAAVCRLRVMGTLPEVRGSGAGRALIQRAKVEAKRRGAAWLWCDAREVALGFYERMGFMYCSEFYEVPEIGRHRMMAIRL